MHHLRAWFSAPDLALTQLVVEVVTTVLILLGLRWLPRRIEEISPLPSSLRKARIRRLRDFLLSTVVGGGMALLSYAMLTRQTPNDISSFYLSRALPEGGGSNVVNVMSVDFRGFDTLGEITVLRRRGADRVRPAATLPPVQGKHAAACTTAPNWRRTWLPTWSTRARPATPPWAI